MATTLNSLYTRAANLTDERVTIGCKCATCAATDGAVAGVLRAVVPAQIDTVTFREGSVSKVNHATVRNAHDPSWQGDAMRAKFDLVPVRG